MKKNVNSKVTLKQAGKKGSSQPRRRLSKKKKQFNPTPLIFAVIVIVGGALAYGPIMRFIEDSNRPPEVKVVKKVAPKKKKVIKKEAPKIVVKETPKFVAPVEKLFSGEIKHYTFTGVVKDRCFSCHGEEGKEIEGKFDFVKFLASGSSNPKSWKILYDEIAKGNMPPEEEEPLSEQEKEVLLAEIMKVASTTTVARATRPLTPNEIKNTVVDLFDVDEGVYNPFMSLYQNYTNEKFYTCQEDIITPYYLEDLYTTLEDAVKSYVSLDVQTEPVNLAVSMPSQSHRVHSHGSNFDLRWTHNNFMNEIHFKNRNPKDMKAKSKSRRTSSKKSAGPETGTDEMLEKLTLPPGTYKLSFTAEALNMNADKYNEKKYGKAIVGTYRDILKKYDYGLPVDFYINPPGQADAYAKSQHITTVNVEKGGKQRYTVKFTLNRRAAISYRFPNKMMPYDGSVASMMAQHILGKSERKDVEAMLEKHVRIPNYHFAQVRFNNLKVEGPLDVQVNGYSFGPDERLDDRTIRSKFKNLHEDAAMKNNTVYSYIFSKLKQTKMNSDEAYRTAMISFFLSPDFLTVGNDKKDKQAYARYVSYAFHKSHPSPDFSVQFAQAQKNKNADKLSEWLVNHSNFTRFIDTFTYQWLGLAEIKNALPEEKNFGTFHVKNFYDAYQYEVFTFMQHLFSNNLPIKELVTADYSFVNEDLKDFYNGGGSREYYVAGRTEIADVNREEFKKHVFSNAKRGGLLAQGAFLTATGNGVDGLPIKRSTWILENLLDSKLPPPPEDIDLTQFESKHSTSLKEKLESHSQNPACYSCHKRIDPLAVIMDSYNTMGGHNNNFQAERVMINGEKISDLADLKNYLGTQDEVLARAFAKSMLKFTLGRELYVQDEPKIDKIIEENRASGFKTRDLMSSILKNFFL
jgi:hypothetical protein